MLTIEEAQAFILDDLRPLGAESIELLGALGRVLAEPLIATRAVPSFDNSAMDGYAVIAQDTVPPRPGEPVTLRCTGTIPAGAVPTDSVTAGTAQRIFTGAPIPAGADAVLIQENVRAEGNRLLAMSSVSPGENVRRQGEDVDVGQTLLERGWVVAPGDIGAAAMQGRTLLPVVRRPRVAIVPTGDEVQEIDLPLGPGQVPNSNSMMIAAQVLEAGAVPIRCPRAPDDPESLARALESACSGVDLVITSGGVSVGDFDHVRQVLERHGQMNFWKVAVKPGKPLAYGRFEGVPVIGLPGNPVSSFVTFELFARPALRKLAGHPRWFRLRAEVELAVPLKGGGARRELLRARWSPEGAAVPHAKRGSAAITSVTAVDLLLDVAAHQEPKRPGDRVAAWVLRPMA